jgi:hypothetical protein
MQGTCESTYRPLTPAAVGAKEWPSVTCIAPPRVGTYKGVEKATDNPDEGVILHDGNGNHFSVNSNGEVETFRAFWEFYQDAQRTDTSGISTSLLVQDAIRDGVKAAVEKRQPFDVGDFLRNVEDGLLSTEDTRKGFRRLQTLDHIRHLSPELRTLALTYLQDPTF